MTAVSPAPSVTPDKVFTGELHVIDSTGDTRHTWNRDNPDDVAAMRATFSTLKDKHYSFFRVNREGNKGEQVRDFDPAAESLIASPAMQGG